MNAHAPITVAEPAGETSTKTCHVEAHRFRSLALNQRAHSHRYREWARESAAKGHLGAEASFNKSADRYASDALWYWMRARNT